MGGPKFFWTGKAERKTPDQTTAKLGGGSCASAMSMSKTGRWASQGVPGGRRSHRNKRRKKKSGK